MSKRAPHPALDRAATLIAGGNVSEMARRLGVSQSRLWGWMDRRHRVPEQYAIQIELETGGAVRVEDVCPTADWHALFSSPWRNRCPEVQQ